MKIKLTGKMSTEEAMESLISVFLLLKEQYEIANMEDIRLKLTLINQDGDEVQLLDAETSQVFDVLEVRNGKVENADPEDYEDPGPDDKTVH